MKCRHCGKLFTQTNTRGPKRTLYCSAYCCYSYRNALRSPGRDKICSACATPFVDKSKMNQCKFCPKCYEFRSEVYRYGLVGKETEALRAIKSCQICGKTTTLCIDHDHVTGEVRGILCKQHNFYIEAFLDDALIKNAVKYLKGEFKCSTNSTTL
jgi:hypothetical protein